MDSTTSRVLELPLNRGKKEVSAGAFAFLFSEIVQYSQSRVNITHELERKLQDLGHGVGFRMLELLSYREKTMKKETRLLAILQFIHSTLWRSLFGKTADALEKSTENEEEYMINEYDPLVNKYVSVPRDMGSLNCAAFVAGIVQGVLDGADFPARVSVHFVAVDGHRPRTTVLMKFSPDVIEREILLRNT